MSAGRPEDGSAPVRRGLRLSIRPRLELVALVRSCVRDTFRFPDADAEGGTLIAVSEVVTNAIEATRRAGSTSDVVVDLSPGPRPLVTVTGHHGPTGGRSAGGSVPTAEERERALVVARAFVPRLMSASTPTATIVTLPINASAELLRPGDHPMG